MVCHGEHTYLYCQLMMHILSQEPKAGANIRRLCQEVHQYAQNKSVRHDESTVAYHKLCISCIYDLILSCVIYDMGLRIDIEFVTLQANIF